MSMTIIFDSTIDWRKSIVWQVIWSDVADWRKTLTSKSKFVIDEKLKVCDEKSKRWIFELLFRRNLNAIDASDERAKLSNLIWQKTKKNERIAELWVDRLKTTADLKAAKNFWLTKAFDIDSKLSQSVLQRNDIVDSLKKVWSADTNFRRTKDSDSKNLND